MKSKKTRGGGDAGTCRSGLFYPRCTRPAGRSGPLEAPVTRVGPGGAARTSLSAREPNPSGLVGFGGRAVAAAGLRRNPRHPSDDCHAQFVIPAPRRFTAPPAVAPPTGAENVIGRLLLDYNVAFPSTNLTKTLKTPLFFLHLTPYALHRYAVCGRRRARVTARRAGRSHRAGRVSRRRAGLGAPPARSQGAARKRAATAASS